MTRGNDDPRDDIVVAVVLTGAVVLIALIPFIFSTLGIATNNLGYIEEIDWILGPVIAAGALGVYLEDRAHWKKNRS